MKRTLPIALGAVLVVASAGIGLAVSHSDDGDFHHRSPLQAMDKNGDGVVDQQEWSAHFTELDRNGNGKLEADELPGPTRMMMMHGDMPPEAVAFFLGHLADTNDDHQVTAAEWSAFITSHDTNRDGALSMDEVHGERTERGDDHYKHFDGNMPPFAQQWDTDHDGKLSAVELDALFKAADKNGDGVLDREDHPFHGDEQQRRR